MKKIMFTVFQGDKSFMYSIKEKEDGVILKDKRKRTHIDQVMFKQLEQLGEKIRWSFNDKTYEILQVYIIPGEKLFLGKKGKTILNIATCIDKEQVLEMVQREATLISSISPSASAMKFYNVGEEENCKN